MAYKMIGYLIEKELPNGLTLLTDGSIRLRVGDYYIEPTAFNLYHHGLYPEWSKPWVGNWVRDWDIEVKRRRREKRDD